MPSKVRSKKRFPSRSKPRYSRKRISKQRRRSNLRKNTRRRNLRKNTRKRNTRKGGGLRRRLRWPRRRVAKKQEEEEEEDWSPPQEQDSNCGGQDLQYCDKLLCGLGINDRETWSAWIKQNHPDKNMDKSYGEKKIIADLVGRVQNCKNSDCYCPR